MFRWASTRQVGIWAAMAASVAMGCSDEPAEPEAARAVAYFELSADLGDAERFFDFPYPSDLRLAEDGTIDLQGFPNPADVHLIDNLLPVAQDRPGFPQVPVAYLRFSGPLGPHEPTQVIPPGADAPVLVIDIDAESPERGQAMPAVAVVLPPDIYVPDHLLAVAPRPGFVLAPRRSYAVVATTALRDAQGRPTEPAEPFRVLRAGGVPSGAMGQAAAELYAPLWPALEMAGVAPSAVVTATVFTTSDAPRELSELSDAVREEFSVDIDDLALDPDDGAEHERFCELLGQMSFPRFQQGTPSYPTEGLFELDADGLPIEQARDSAPVVITLPKQPMPPGGYPLVMYFHGSGGLSSQVVDRGRVTVPGGQPTKGEGPAHVLAAHGFAAVGSAHPVNPERVPGAGEIEYLKFDNLAAFRDTFRQGVIEQRLLLDALLELEIEPELLDGCDGPSLPGGAAAYRFASQPVLAMGQSMGGMYTNIIGAVEPRIEAVVPTGAGGFWSYFILETSLVGGKELVPILIDSAPELSFMHPVMHLMQTAWEPAEPMVYMPRLGRRPLPEHPVRPVYEPVAIGDSYFPTVLYDAIALAYGHEQAGEVVWPTMQEALALAELDGIASYPVSDNLSSIDGVPYTGVVVQYEGDGIYDPHAVFAQLDEVKYQYGCFFASFLAEGTAVVPAPAELGTACPVSD